MGMIILTWSFRDLRADLHMASKYCLLALRILQAHGPYFFPREILWLVYLETLILDVRLFWASSTSLRSFVLLCLRTVDL
jgi:hypothetical protein